MSVGGSCTSTAFVAVLEASPALHFAVARLVQSFSEAEIGTSEEKLQRSALLSCFKALMVLLKEQQCGKV